MAERILVIGAGMAGLQSALALARDDREILILERDPPAPDGGVEAAFEDWHRRGVGQMRHSHGFLARLRNIIKARHPALLDELKAAGCREIVFSDMLPPALRADYQPEPEDEALTLLTMRRTTFELVLRRYVEELPGVTILPNVFVRTLTIENETGGALKVTGAEGEVDGVAETWRADVVIDAAGRGSDAADQLALAGAKIAYEEEPCGILYFTRHYRLLGDEPPRNPFPSTGDLNFLKFGRFPGDNGRFSVTLAVPELEGELRQAVLKPEVFDHICALLPGLAPWVDPTFALPTSKVFGMGELKSHWRGFVGADQPAVTGFFAVGDSLARTNPLYGRGCSFAAVEADILRQVFEEADEPSLRARLYDSRVRDELRTFYDVMCDQDRGAIRRARRALAPDEAEAPSLRSRILGGFLADGVSIAVRSDIALMRAALREFNMVDAPRLWARKPQNVVKFLGRWARGKRANAHLYPPSPGPGRTEVMTALGL
jgi:2-polyprenyl-6-methoxyphenol hydroxylase-like FAD-dependent oxidoreductase